MKRKKTKRSLKSKRVYSFVLFIKRNGQTAAFVVGIAIVGSYMLLNSNAATGNDLVVTQLAMSPENPDAGQQVTFSATIENQGSTETTQGTVVSVSFEVDGEVIAWNRSYTDSIAPGESVTLDANEGVSGAYWNAVSGPHTLIATVDDMNVIPDELNEANNSRTLGFTVGSTGSLYLDPVSASVFVNEDVSFDLRLTPEVTVDGVDATITYNPAKFEFVSMDSDDSPFDIELRQQAGDGSISLTRGNLSGGVSNDALIATITFKALVGNGSGVLDVNGNAATGGVYTNPTARDTTVTFRTPDTTAPSVSIASPSASATVFMSETVNINANDDSAVTKVELYIDGQLKGTDTSAPYSFEIDTRTLANGNRALQAKAYDEAGNIGTSQTINVMVKNWAEDINRDGQVSLLDFSLLALELGKSGSDLGPADINGDAKVDLLDFSRLASRFGQ